MNLHAPDADTIPSQTVLERILDRFKINVPFFETQALTCPEPLEITDVSDDLSRELQLYVLDHL